MKDTSARVQLFAMQALGRLAHAPAVPSILALLEQNNDEDAWLRHAGMIALGRIGQEEPLAALDQHPSKALRTVAVVALRRMKSPAVARFLSDSDEYIAAEAARAINDDYSIEEALPALASSLAGTSFQGEAFLRRAINANLRVGQPENRQILLDYIQDQEAPQAMRAEALAALSTWGKTSVFDRVDGRYRGSMERDPAAVLVSLQPLIGQFLQDPAVAVQLAAVQAVGRLQMKGQAEALFALLQSSSSVELRRQSLKMLQQLEAPQLADALQLAIEDKEEAVRAEALALLPASEVGEAKAVQIYRTVIEQGSVRERQSALRALGQFHGEEAVQTLGGEMRSLMAGTMEAAVQLDLIEAVEAQKDEKLLVRLASYQDSKSEDDPLALYREALAGGDVAKGRKIFYEHEAAQCVRCHAIFEYGGNAGPGLAGVGKRLTAEQLLESVVLPSAQLAEGYGIVVLQLKAGETLSGIVVEETDELIKLRSGKGEVRTFAQADIASRQDMPSSMPSMSSILDKGQIRDVVAFLGSLR
ncbi:MAG: HEAT repeat domain-containing protein [Bacteroidota bacterium]